VERDVLKRDVSAKEPYKTDVYGPKATYHIENEIYVYEMTGTYVKGDAYSWEDTWEVD